MREVTIVAWLPFRARVRASLQRHGGKWTEVRGPLLSTFVARLPRAQARAMRRELRRVCHFHYGVVDDEEILNPVQQHALLAFVVLYSAYFIILHAWPDLLR